MKLLLFGGTSEGRLIAEAVAGSRSVGEGAVTKLYVCVATGYGACLLPEDDRIIISRERMTGEEMAALIKREDFDACIDATHPYAGLVSKNIREACSECGLPLYRVSRENMYDKEYISNRCGRMVFFDTIREAVAYLNEDAVAKKGNILITTGSKDVGEYTAVNDFAKRCYVRVLPSADAVEKCTSLGFMPAHIICMQGPFSKELNEAMIKECKASCIVTKESGHAGGFEAKIDAAMDLGITCVVIGRPEEPNEKTYTLNEVLDIFGIKNEKKKKAYLIGMGCAGSQLTRQALDALIDSDHIIGAGRIIRDLEELDGTRSVNNNGAALRLSDKRLFVCYDRDEQERYIKDNAPERVALLYSGDIGFYSGAAGIIDRLDGYEIVTVPGVSSGIYLCDKLMIPWQNVRFLSCHGRELDIKNEISHHKRLLILLGGEDDAAAICRDLCETGHEDAAVYIGEELGYKHEEIRSGRAEDMTDIKTSSLAVLLVILEKDNR